MGQWGGSKVNSWTSADRFDPDPVHRFSAYGLRKTMGSLARKVASRWCLRVVSASPQLPLPPIVIAWGDAIFHSMRVAYIGERDDYSVTPILDPETFTTAKYSLNGLLPKFQDLLRAKFHERFTAHISQAKNRIYYFFSGTSQLESFAITLTVHHGQTFLSLGYVPHHVETGELDFARKVEVSERASDPEVVGLSLMRLTKRLLSRI